jgi:hypothetical protein
MSNINQTNNLYTIDTVQDLSQESAAAIQGGAEIVVYTDADFRGKSLILRGNNANGQHQFLGAFNNSISSIKVLSGTWQFFTNSNRTGLAQTLKPGNYRRLDAQMNDTISLAVAKFA